MRRREFIAGVAAGTVARPFVADAQSTRKPVIGVLYHSNPEPSLGLLRNALRAVGYVEGETIELDVRVAESSQVRLSEMAAALVARKVELIVASTTPAVAAAKAATPNIPIIMAGVADPVGSELVASLARPGGNITGNSLAIGEMAGKNLGLLREAVPQADRIGILVNTADPFHVRFIEFVEFANRSVKADLRTFKVGAPSEIAAAFDAMKAAKIEAAIIQPTLPRKDVIRLALAHRLPTASPIRGYAEEGGLMSYAGNVPEQYGLAAAYVDRILKGTKPADLPVVQPTKFEFFINLRTAKALQIEIPVTLLARADEVIE